MTIRQDLRARVFRANAAFTLIPLEEVAVRLSLAGPLLDGLRADDDCFGVAVPIGDPRLGAKAVCRETARLFNALREARPLPEYLAETKGAQLDRDLAGLVSDGLLEVEVGGEFRCGPAAQLALAEARLPIDPPALTARLSYEALRYAQSLPELDVRWLAARLYHFNHVPEGPVWRRRMATPADVQHMLGLEAEPNRRTLRAAFDVHDTPNASDEGWRVWQLRSHAQAPSNERLAGPRGTYKLYISPRPEALADALAKAIPIFADFGVCQFKLGRDRGNLLRADKFVAYFPDRSELERVAQAVAAEAAGLPAQGVPFTAAWGDDGLLSWGVDPPINERLSGWTGQESWRLWLVHRLARALAVARDESTPVEPWVHALNRVALDGIDVATWTPTAELWAAEERGSS